MPVLNFAQQKKKMADIQMTLTMHNVLGQCPSIVPHIPPAAGGNTVPPANCGGRRAYGFDTQNGLQAAASGIAQVVQHEGKANVMVVVEDRGTWYQCTLQAW